MLSAVPILLVKLKTYGFRCPRRHWRRESTILSAALAVQLIRKMECGLVASLGLGMGWMSAAFHMDGIQPAIQEQLTSSRTVASPDGSSGRVLQLLGQN